MQLSGIMQHHFVDSDFRRMDFPLLHKATLNQLKGGKKQAILHYTLWYAAVQLVHDNNKNRNVLLSNLLSGKTRVFI